MVAIPTLEEEDAKRPNRERENLVGERTRIVNRMKGYLARLGIRNLKSTLRKASGLLATLYTPEGRPERRWFCKTMARMWNIGKVTVKFVRSTLCNSADDACVYTGAPGMQEKVQRSALMSIDLVDLPHSHRYLRHRDWHVADQLSRIFETFQRLDSTRPDGRVSAC